MLKVKVLGFGCHRCQLVEQIAAEELAKVLRHPRSYSFFGTY